MSEERNLFGMLDNISAGQVEILSEIKGVKTHVDDADSKIAELELEIQRLKTKPTQNTQPQITSQKSDKEILMEFLKQSKKSLRWFGTKGDFVKWKTLAIISLLILFIVGIASTVVTSICLNMYSTFTFFENAWLVFGIFHLIYALKTKYIYEVNELASNSSARYEKDEIGMLFPRKEKIHFRIFFWLAIISAISNIICIWAGLGKTNNITATIMEIVFLAAIVLAFFLYMNLFAQYSIIWIEGHNLTNKEKVVLVLPPGAKHLIPEEEFKKTLPFMYE